MSTDRRADPFGVGALAAAGTMAAHELGYLVDRSTADGTHAYFDVLGPLVLLAACVAAWIAALRIVHRDAGRAPSFAVLVALQLGGYVMMEVGERLVTGSLTTLPTAPVVVGLALQPLVALAARHLLRVGRLVIESLLGAASTSPSPTRTTPSTPATDLVGTLLPLRLRVRGPPVR